MTRSAQHTSASPRSGIRRPFIPDALESMAAAGPARIMVLLLSPFFTSVTTGNYIDVAKDYLAKAPPSDAGVFHP